MAELNPVVGREQAGQRPVLVLSSDAFNASPAELVSILPVTTRERPIPTRIELKAGEGGLPRRSFVITEQVGTVSIHRLRHRLGTVPAVALEGVADAVRVFLDL
jgi:mRNA interferase MazF